MQACKLSKIVCIVLASTLGCGVFAQNSIFDISMPSIDPPSLGNGFYTPSGRLNPVYTGNAYTEKKDSESGETAAESEKPSPLAKTPAALSASEIQSLGSRGLLGNFSSMFNRLGQFGQSESEYSIPVNLYTSSSTDETNELLKKVLSAIEEIKETDVAANARADTDIAEAEEEPEDENSLVKQKMPHVTTNKKIPHILKFSVNGYNILPTCRTIYFSDIQDDGTFFLTGDRKYMSDKKARIETFHILFRTSPGSSSFEEYDSAAAVTQDERNPNSFLYQLSQRRDLTASRTGGLVSMHTDDADWKLELLIDLGEER